MLKMMSLAVMCTWLALPLAAEEPQPPVPSITTTGEAVVRRAPDQAFVTIAVETRARSPRDAQRQNAEGMTAVQQRLSAAGVPKDAIRTIGYSIQQEFDFANGAHLASTSQGTGWRFGSTRSSVPETFSMSSCRRVPRTSPVCASK
jgi:uncharacterized protein YggE